MTLLNPPPAVTAIRDMLLACSSITGAGITTTSIWYPTAVAESDDATPVDALPRIIVAEDSFTRVRYAEGARGLPTGSLSIVLCVDTDAGTLETLGRAVCGDLEFLSQTQGLANLTASVGMASDPDAAQIAADDTTGDTASRFCTITITASYGLNA